MRKGPLLHAVCTALGLEEHEIRKAAVGRAQGATGYPKSLT